MLTPLHQQSASHVRRQRSSPPYDRQMITAVHGLIYSRQAEAVRVFLRDKLGWDHVDSGGGWLIFALPPAELCVHPTDGEPGAELYLMCDDIEATVAELTGRDVEVTEPV